MKSQACWHIFNWHELAVVIQIGYFNSFNNNKRSILSYEKDEKKECWQPQLFQIKYFSALTITQEGNSNLHPRKPSIGFTSDSFSILEKISSSFMPVSEVSSLTICSRSPSGRNSWSGGSNNRMVTGHPEIHRFNKINFQWICHA